MFRYIRYKVVSIDPKSKNTAIQSLVDVNVYKLVLKSSLAKILYPAQAAEEEAEPHNTGILYSFKGKAGFEFGASAWFEVLLSGSGV